MLILCSYCQLLQEDLFECVAASEKLGFVVVKIVLQEDGTEVDGDEELLAFAGSTLVALKDREVWAPVSATPSPATTDQTTILAPLAPVDTEQPVTGASAGPAPMPAPAASCSSMCFVPYFILADV